MKVKWLLGSIIIIFVCLFFFIFLAQRDSALASSTGSEKIESSLSDQILAGGATDYIIRFTEQADLSPAYALDWDQRGEYVYDTLKATAELSQSNAKAILDAQGLAYQTFIAGNDLYVYASNQTSIATQQTTEELAVLNALAALPEVSSIRAPQTYTIDPVVKTTPFDSIRWAGDFLANHLMTTVGTSMAATIDWGISDTKADQFWSTLGAKGAGIKVANIDTGVQWNHPALINQFACPNDPTNPNCWYDPTGVCGPAGACDNNGHGTHTMGTMVAKDDPALPYIAGMAPDASWIACKGCGTDNCSDAGLLACADWILAPGGNPANRPNVVNNSWGGPGGNTWFLAKIQAWRAAGIFPAFSAGNNYYCNSLTSPGDYQESFASTSHTSPVSSRLISDFSSKGPSFFGNTPYTKPNISAPGTAIWSTVPINRWSAGSGTSMASPHAAGAVALLWSCNPALKGQVDATFQVLQSNADTPFPGTCGAPPSGQGNYTYGYGYLNVLAAGTVACNIINLSIASAVMKPDQITPLPFTISNLGTSTLNWSIEESSLVNTVANKSSGADQGMVEISNNAPVTGTGLVGNQGLGVYRAATDPIRQSLVNDVPWLTETPTSGAIAPGEHTDVTITLNSTGLAPGVYRASLVLHSNNPFPPVLSIPVYLIVTRHPVYLGLISKR